MKIFTQSFRGLVLVAIIFMAAYTSASAQSLSFTESSLTFTTSGSDVVPNKVLRITSSDNSKPLITLSDDPHAAEWLIFPSLASTGDVTIGVKSGLSPGTYNTSLIAIADGYTSAEIPVELTVTQSSGQQPRVTGFFPPDGSQGIPTSTSLSANNLFLPNGQNGIFGVDNRTISDTRVKLRKLPSGALVPATVNGTGGGDAINLTPSVPLEANTTYRFEIDGVTDLTGSPFELFYSEFTTSGSAGSGDGDLARVSFTSAGPIVTEGYFTSLTVGPDSKLYALSINGSISRWNIALDGTLSNRQNITTLTNTYGGRSAVGFTFSPTATAENLVAFVSHASEGQIDGPPWDGKISRLSGVNLENEDLVVTNLPRSRRDHLTNSIAFRPGEDRVLYFLQGSNTAGGATDRSWGFRQERLLSGAALRLDLNKLPEADWPLDAKTTMDAAAINAVDIYSKTLGSGNGTYTENNVRYNDDGTYNPYYVEAPLTLFATGVRNAYDLVWHSNGQMYIPTNGTAAGSNSPASINGTRRPNGSIYNHNDPSGRYPKVDALYGTNTQRDWLFRVDPDASLGYYGHPNPLRGEFVLNRGAIDADGYPVGIGPDPNFRGAAYDFAYNISPNGVIEYRSNAENGNLQGALIVCRYSGGSDLIALVPDGPNGDIKTTKIGIPGFSGFSDPLDLTEDRRTGNLYVSDLGNGTITLLKPSNQATPQPLVQITPNEITTDAVVGETSTFTIFISNVGNAALQGATATLTGSQSAQYKLDASGLPATLSPNSSASVQVEFTPTSAGAKFANLNVSGVNTGTVTIPLKGLGKNGTTVATEPSLQQIFDVFGIGLDAGDPNPATGTFEGTKTQLNSLLGAEVNVKQFQRASDGPVELELLAAFSATKNNDVVSLGWHITGQATSLNGIFEITDNGSGNSQTLHPSIFGGTTFDPGSSPFGLYTQWAAADGRKVFGEDIYNTFSGALPHQVRVYPMPGETDAYVMAFDGKTSNYDFQDLVVVIRNVEPASGGVLAANPEELVFEAMITTDGPQSQTKSVTLVNNSLATVSVSGVSLAGPFASQYDYTGVTSFNMVPGAERTLQVRYAPDLNSDNLGYQPATLRVVSNLNGSDRLDIGLHGLKKAGYAGGSEPPLQDIVDALGYKINVGWTTLSNNTSTTPQGEEVKAPTFRAADPGPVTLVPVARYSPVGTVPFGYYTPTNTTNPTLRQIGTLGASDANAQTLFPTQSGGTSFDPGSGVFGIYAKADGQNVTMFSEDALNTTVPHRIRIYPLRDREGNRVINSYLVTMEEATNGDYQDMVFVLSNVKPVGPDTKILTFSEPNILIEAPRGGISNGYPVQVTSSVPLEGVKVSMETTESWLAVAAEANADGTIKIAVDATNLKNGNYVGNVIATAPGFVPATLRVRVDVKDNVAYNLMVNFQDSTFAPPTGWLRDFGRPYGSRGNGLVYGWFDYETKQPANNYRNMRGREYGLNNGSSEEHKLMHSYAHLDWVGLNPRQRRYWEADVPNGRYLVEVAVGDLRSTRSLHRIRAEGVVVVDNFRTSTTDRFAYFDAEVEVKDGKLTIDDYGIYPDGEVKLVYLKATQLTGDWLPPYLTMTTTGPKGSSGNFSGSATVTLSATASTQNNSVASLSYTVNSDGEQAYTAPFTLTLPAGVNSKEYHVTARAVDARGNASTKDTTFTIVRETGAVLRIENMLKMPGTQRAFPANDRVVLHGVKGEPTRNGEPIGFRTRSPLRFHNDGTSPLVITNITTTDNGRFVIENAPTSGQSLTIPAGQFADLVVRFTANEPLGTSPTIFEAELITTSNADNASAAEVDLIGVYNEALEGNNEISNQQAFEAFGWKTEMGRTDFFDFQTRPSSDRPSDEEVASGDAGDMILPGLFVQADFNNPVTMMHIGALHGPGGAESQIQDPQGQWYNRFTYDHDGLWYNTLLPQARFATEEFQVAGKTHDRFSNPFQFSVAQYRTLGGTPGMNLMDEVLGVRVYKIIDQQGNVVPNEYVLIQDYVGSGCEAGGGNCDWQDNIVYVTNVRPQGTPTAGQLADMLVEAGVTEKYDASSAFTVGYPGNKLEYSVTYADGSPIPSWIVVDPGRGTVSVTAPFSTAGASFDLKITGTDYNDLKVSTNLRVVVGSDDDNECTVNANVNGTPKSIYCSGSTVRLSGFAATGIYRWTGPNGFTSSVANPIVSEAGVYTLVSQTIGGVSCGASSTVTVTADLDNLPAPTVSAPTYALDCTVRTIKLTANSDFATPSYEWFLNGSSVGFGKNFTVGQGGVYTLKASDESGCTASTQVEITDEFTPLPAGNGGTIGVCVDAAPFSLFARLQSLGGSPTPGGVWTFADNVVSDTQNPASMSSGTYRYSVGDNDACSPSFADLTVNVSSPTVYYRDADGDGYGDANDSQTFCGVAPTGYTIDNTDCDDGNPATHPNAVEVCDGFDNNCDGRVDEGAICDAGVYAMRINAGGPSVLNGGKQFISDRYSSTGYAAEEPAVTADSLYRTYRSSDDTYMIEYDFPLPNGNYRVLLHFIEPFWGVTVTGGAGNRKFDVFLESKIVLNDFDISSEVSPGTPLVKEFPINNSNGAFNLTLDARSDYGGVYEPIISGIEVIGLDASTPNDDPIAIPDATPKIGEAPLSVRLDGSKSYDPDGPGIATYEWNYSGGSLDGAVQNLMLEAGEYDFTLTVTDYRGATASKAVAVSVKTPGQDTDNDGIIDLEDNCPNQANPGQEDTNKNGIGDVCEAPVEPQSQFWLEAECGLVGSGWTVVNSAAASGGKYAVFTTGTSMNDAPADVPANRIRFSVNNVEAGNYFLFARVNAPSPDDDSYYVRVNGGEWLKWNGEFTQNAGFAWNVYTQSQFSLTAGSNTIDFAYREDGTQLDKLHLTKSSTLPIGAGGTATNCTTGPANQPPVAKAEASPATGTAPLSVQLSSAGSDDPDGNIVSYNWNWNGGSAVGANPTVVFPAGNYVVTLTVTDNGGLTDTEMVNVSATTAPGTTQSSFWLEAECATVGSNWTVVNSANASNGKYAVVLSGNAYNPAPTDAASRIRFNLNNAEAGNYALFARVSAPTTDDDSFWVRINGGEWYMWNNAFKTGVGFAWNSYTGPQVSLAAGSNTVDFAFRENGTLLDKVYLSKSSTVPTDVGGMATNCTTGPVNQPPVAEASATPTSGTAPLLVNFSSTGSKDSDGEIVSYSWNWSGGSATGESPNHTFAAGTYAVTLTVTDDDGAMDTDVVTINATSPPGTAQSTFWLEAECATVGTNWTVVNDASASGGKYAYVSSGNSLSDAPTDVPANRIRFSFGNVEAGNYALFARVNAATTGDDSYWVRINGGSWQMWNNKFKTGVGFAWNAYTETAVSLTAGANTIDFAYREDGTLLDKLYLSKSATEPTGTGGTATNCTTGPVNQPPVAEANATPTSGTAPLLVQLSSAGSTDSDGDIVSYSWNWSGGSATGESPSHTFAAGTYAVTLTVTDNGGATATDVVTINVSSPPGTTQSSFWLEAECAIVGSNWTVGNSAAAAGGKYVFFSSGNSLSEAPADVPENRIRFNLSNAEAGNYFLFARVDAPSTGDDSFWVRVNGGNWEMWNNEFKTGVGFSWNAFSKSPLSLKAGSNTVDFAYREDGTLLDKIYLGKSNTVPTGLGIPATNCGAGTTKQLPIAQITSSAYSGTAPLQVTLDGSGSNDPDGGDIQSFNWSWNGGTATGSSVVETFPTGTYNVTLTVVDDEAQSGSTVIQIVAQEVTEDDADSDNVPDSEDNCPTVFNPDQSLFTFYGDFDGDGFGDPDDVVTDCSAPANFVDNASDNCPAVFNPGQEDTDGDGTGDACEETVSLQSEFWLEAECAVVGSNWVVASDASASGGSFAHAPTQTHLSAPPADIAANRIRFTLRNAEAGSYNMIGLISAAGPSSDSYWFRVNNGPWVSWYYMTREGVFRWTAYSDAINLVEGDNVIDFAFREGETKLDKLHVDKDATAPTGFGAAATNCQQQLPPQQFSADNGGEQEAEWFGAKFLQTTDADEVSTYPNPTRTDLNVAVRSGFQGRVMLSLHDMTGKQVRKLDLDKESDVLQTNLEMRDLPPGVYRLVVIEGENQSVTQVVKVR